MINWDDKTNFLSTTRVICHLFDKPSAWLKTNRLTYVICVLGDRLIKKRDTQLDTPAKKLSSSISSHTHIDTHTYMLLYIYTHVIYDYEGHIHIAERMQHRSSKSCKHPLRIYIHPTLWHTFECVHAKPAASSKWNWYESLYVWRQNDKAISWLGRILFDRCQVDTSIS